MILDRPALDNEAHSRESASDIARRAAEATGAPGRLAFPMTAQLKTAGRRRCWWCNATPTRDNPLTNEHIIAKWFAKVMRGEGKMNHAYRDHGAIEDARHWSSSEPSFKAGVVCRACNNGWMSDLETEAERLLPDFVHAEPRLTVGFDNGPVLARWAAKTALLSSWG